MNEIELIIPTAAHEDAAKAYLQAHFDHVAIRKSDQKLIGTINIRYPYVSKREKE